MKRNIYCCSCEVKTLARLTNGKEIYPDRDDLKDIPFWICRRCSNYVGCYYKTNKRLTPLGSIPTPEIREAGKKIHIKLDSMCSSSKERKKIYKFLSEKLCEYYDGEILNTGRAGTILYLLDQYKKVCQ